MPTIKNNNNKDHANPKSTVVEKYRPIFYQDYLKLMHAIHSQNLSKVREAIQKTRYLRFFINYRDPERHFETPLRYALTSSNGNCSGALIELLMSQTANTQTADEFGVTPYQFGAKNCRNWLEIEEVFDHSLPERAVMTTIPIIDTTTALTPYKAKVPYEYHIVIYIPMSLFKGSFTALSRFTFEKLQKHSLFVRRHPVLFFVAQPMIESILMSATNLLYFPSIKGNVRDLNALFSGGLYFSMDLALMFGFGLINSRLQPLLDSSGGKDRGSWWFLKKLGSSTLFTLFFLFSNISIILGEKFQDNKVEVLLNIFFNAVVGAFMHQVTYAGVNSLANWLTEESEQAAVVPVPELQKFIALPMMSLLAEKEESPIYQNIGSGLDSPQDASFNSGHSSGYASSLTESMNGAPIDKKNEVKQKSFFINTRRPSFFMQTTIDEQSEPLYEVPLSPTPGVS